MAAASSPRPGVSRAGNAAGADAGAALDAAQLLAQSGQVTNAQDAARLLSEAIACERDVDHELQAILARRSQVEQSLASAKDSLGLLGLMQRHAETIAASTRHASELADKVSGRVRELDASQGRVASAMARLDALVEASQCADDLQSALDGERYAEAAELVQRFSQLYDRVAAAGEADPATPSAPATPASAAGASTPRASSSFLSESGDAAHGLNSPAHAHPLASQARVVRRCAVQLREAVLGRFEKAAAARDHAEVKRLASILGPIGLVQNGVAAFSKYLVGLVASRAHAEFDALLGELAAPADPAGAGKGPPFARALTQLYRDVAEALEANVGLMREAYGEEGLVEVVLSLHEEAQTRAVQILRRFVDFRKPAALADQARRAMQKAGGGSGVGGGERERDPIALERLIEEIVVLCVRSEEYNKVVKGVLGGAASQGVEHATRALGALGAGPLNCLVRELNSYYIALEDAYMEMTGMMAVAMDECVDGSLTSSVVDDIFFILQKCGRRALATGNAQCLCAVLNNVNNLLCNTYMAAMRQDAAVYEPLVLASAAAMGDAMGAAEGGVGVTQADVTQAAQAVNNFDVSADYVQKLKVELDRYIVDVFDAADDRKRVQSCLADLTKTSSEFRKKAERAVDVIANKLLPRLKQPLDVLASLSYKLSEADYATSEANDPWVTPLLGCLGDHVGWLQPVLTADAYEGIVHALLGSTAKRVEALLLQKRFNQLGGLLVEKEIRSVVMGSASLTQRTVRGHFARLSNMATLLTLESTQEAADIVEEAGMRLTSFEIKRVMKLRVDFNHADVELAF